MSLQEHLGFRNIRLCRAFIPTTTSLEKLYNVFSKNEVEEMLNSKTSCQHCQIIIEKYKSTCIPLLLKEEKENGET